MTDARSRTEPAEQIQQTEHPEPNQPPEHPQHVGTLSGEPPGQPALVEALGEALGGKRGMADSGLPAVVFIFANSVVTAFADKDAGLRVAIAAALLCGLGIVAVRLRRRETLQQAVSGFFAVGIAAFFAARSGEARGFFLPGIFINLGWALAFAGSAVAARPLVGYVYAAVDGLTGWREDPRLRRTFGVATLGWAGVFAARAGVQGALYLADRPTWLAASRLLMGWPLTILAAGVTIAYVRRARR